MFSYRQGPNLKMNDKEKVEVGLGQQLMECIFVDFRLRGLFLMTIVVSVGVRAVRGIFFLFLNLIMFR